jgi:hypothetical protein
VAGHAQYDVSREIWNRCFDRRPSIIVRCTSTADVIAAVRFAREHDLEIAIRGGGHHVAGYASTDGGVLLDLSGLRAIEINPVHPIGPSVAAGLIYFPLADFPELVDHHRKRISRFPNELTTWFFLRLAPPVSTMPVANR